MAGLNLNLQSWPFIPPKSHVDCSKAMLKFYSNAESLPIWQSHQWALGVLKPSKLEWRGSTPSWRGYLLFETMAGNAGHGGVCT